MNKSLMLALTAAAAVLTSASMAATPEQKDVEVGIVEKLGQKVPLDAAFKDEQGNEVTLGDVIDGPTVLALVYFKCPGICTPLLNGVTEVVNKTDAKPGKDYRVIAISFSPQESHHVAAEKKKNYLELIDKDFPPEAWRFLTGDEKNIQAVTEAVGFKYKKEKDQYAHAAAIVMLSHDGTIVRYLYGTTYLPFDLKMAIAEANQGKPGPTINRLLLYCFGYDPGSHKYVMRTTQLSMAFIFLCALGFFVYLGLSSRKRGRIQAGE